MSLFVKSLLVALLAVHVAYAADTVRADTVRVRMVHVSAPRFYINTNTSSTAATFVSREMLVALNPIQISDVFQLVPGVFIKDYGGIGGVKSISVRGGSAAQTLVLLDGIPLNTAQNGQVDLSMIPASFIQSTTVQRGGSSAKDGANALSGVVNFQLKLPSLAQTSVRLHGGSFDEWRINGSSSAPLSSSITLGGAVELMGTSGAYPIAVDYDSERIIVNRANGDVRNVGGMLRFQYGNDLSIDVIGRAVERGIPGAIVSGSLGTPLARLNENDVLSMFKQHSKLGRYWELELLGSVRFLNQQYKDPSALWAGSNGIDDTYKTRDGMVSASALFDHHHIRLSNTVRFGYTDLFGNNLIDQNAQRVHRSTLSFSSNYEHQEVVLRTFQTNAGVRVDVLSDIGSAFSANLGVRNALTEKFIVRSSWSYNFRPPSFNELYYLNYGSKNLKAERSHTLNAGTGYSPTSWLSVEADAFAMFTNNLIVSVPINPVVTSAQNVGVARTLGLEVKANANLFANDVVHVVWSYTLQDARDATGRAYVDGTPIPYVPQELFNVSIFYDDDVWFGNLRWNYTGFRFSQLGGEYTSLLPSYHILGGSLGIHASGAVSKTDVRLQVDNLFNARYDIVRGFPMPGISARIVVGISI